MHCHLVTVEVGVERRADERVQVDGLALNQLRLERLDAQAVKRRRAVEQHGVLADDLFEDVPHLGTRTLDHALRRLDVLRVVELDEALHDEGLEELERHLLGQAALVQLEPRADHDDRTARVVDALAEQVLTEATLLALEHVRDGLERTVSGPGDGAATTTVVEQRVDRFLEHALLVIHDDLGGTEIQQTLEAVVAVDDTAVEVVEVGGREAATVQLHHRTQVRGNHWNGVEHHAGRVVRRGEERVDHLEALERARLALALAVRDDLAQVVLLGRKVEVIQTTLDRLGTHRALEVRAVATRELAVEQLVSLEVLDLEADEAVEHGGKAVDLLVKALADVCHLALCGVLHLALGVGLCALGLELGEVLLELFRALVDAEVARVGEVLLLLLKLVAELRQVLVTAVDIDLGHHVGGEVDDLLKVLGGKVEKVAEARRNALEVPDVRHGSSELDVAHALTAHLGTGHLDATALTDDAAVADTLVLAAATLPVTGGAKDLLAEQAVLLWLERAVVDRFWLLHLAV